MDKKVQHHNGPPYAIKCTLLNSANPPALFTCEKKIRSGGWMSLSNANGYRTKQIGMASILYVPPVKTTATYYRCTARNSVGTDADVIRYWT